MVIGWTKPKEAPAYWDDTKIKTANFNSRSFDEFYAKLKDIVNSAFNLGETILEPKIVRKVLRSLLERFHAQYTVPSGPKCF